MRSCAWRTAAGITSSGIVGVTGDVARATARRHRVSDIGRVGSWCNTGQVPLRPQRPSSALNELGVTRMRALIVLFALVATPFVAGVSQVSAKCDNGQSGLHRSTQGTASAHKGLCQPPLPTPLLH